MAPVVKNEKGKFTKVHYEAEKREFTTSKPTSFMTAYGFSPSSEVYYYLSTFPYTLSTLSRIIKETLPSPAIERIWDLLREISKELKEIKEDLKELKEAVKPVAEEEIELHKIPKEEAKKKIFEYIKGHPGCLTGDIILNLGLDPDLVLEVLGELEREERVEGTEPPA